MLSELAKGRKVTGIKQTRRAVLTGSAEAVYIAEDAEMRLRLELSKLCEQYGVSSCYVPSMKELGKACGIRVGASAAALLK